MRLHLKSFYCQKCYTCNFVCLIMSSHGNFKSIHFTGCQLYVNIFPWNLKIVPISQVHNLSFFQYKYNNYYLYKSAIIHGSCARQHSICVSRECEEGNSVEHHLTNHNNRSGNVNKNYYDDPNSSHLRHVYVY